MERFTLITYNISFIFRCSHVKKSQLFKKNIKLRIEVAEDPEKKIFKVNFRF